jgi:hypothetical protein
MACSLDLSGLRPTCAANAKVTIKLIADTAILQSASLNDADLTPSIDPGTKSVSFAVPKGRNTVLLVLFPPPAPEPLQVVEDCGQGKTQPILTFASGIHASVSFDIIAT